MTVRMGVPIAASVACSAGQAGRTNVSTSSRPSGPCRTTTLPPGAGQQLETVAESRARDRCLGHVGAARVQRIGSGLRGARRRHLRRPQREGTTVDESSAGEGAARAQQRAAGERQRRHEVSPAEPTQHRHQAQSLMLSTRSSG
jgi:hypothetical protein